jgi:hypothetical protein
VNSAVTLKVLVSRAIRADGTDFDKAFPGISARIEESIRVAFEQLLIARDRLNHVETPTAMVVGVHDRLAWQLLWEATNAALAAHVLLERNYRTEPLGIMRAILERVACAVVLHDNPSCVPSFLSGRLKATKMVTHAGKAILNLGPIYGTLSEIGSHVKDSIGASEVFSPNGRPLLGIGGVRSVDQDQVVLQFTTIVEEVLASAPVNIFFNQERREAVLR